MGRDADRVPGRETGPIATAGLTIALLLFSAVLIRYTDNFFADDSYFYLQVASNAAHGLGSTFNGIMPTNGYHPLWMLVCIAVFSILTNKLVAVHAIGVVLSLLNLGTLLLLRSALIHAGVDCWWCAWLLYMPFCFTSQLGTEGAISGFFLAALILAKMLFMKDPTQRMAFALSACAGLAVLSRLDNVFVVSACAFALLLRCWRTDTSAARRLLVTIPLPLAMWGVYVASNLHWFGTVQPISGMLKVHARGEHALFTNLPHTAYLDLAILLPGLAILAFVKRDEFSKLIEIPFAAGILLHALYIVFVMSSETRWSWYYTSWTLLASIVLARLASLLLARQASSHMAYGGGLAALALLAAWYLTSYRRMAHEDLTVHETAFEKNVSERAGLKRLLAFDKPGRIAFYTSAHVIPLDGLMGNLRFQMDLAQKGIEAFDTANGIDGFIGPPQPMSESAKALFCDRVFLSSVRFHCVPGERHTWEADGVEVFSRLTGQSAGLLALPPDHLVWTAPHQVAVWRLPHAQDRRP